MHGTPLIATLVAGFGLAFLFGSLAKRLRLPPIAGYLAAGIVVGPATPGYVADTELAPELAEIGVMLLMFGVGLHFSLRDLLSVRRVAIPGAVGQIAVATALGAGLGWWLGWPLATGLVFGLALSVASTVVLLRALEERRLVETTRGRIAVGWLIVEDLVMVLALVLIPVLAEAIDGAEAGLAAVLAPLALTLAKVAAFVGLMLVVGRRAIPWALERAAGSGSRELFTLAVLAVALGIAYVSAHVFGVSFALGAFVAGMVLAESELSHRAGEDSLPLRDAFAVLFFVSVGMLFNPAILVEAPLAALATTLIIVVGKSIAAYLIVRALGEPQNVAATVSASLGQIGEFSFILATLGLSLGLLPPAAQDLIIAGAIASIVLNPLLFAALDRFAPPPAVTAAVPELGPPGHSVIAGYGFVGRQIAAGLRERGQAFVVVDDRAERDGALTAEGGRAIEGNAADPKVLADAGVAQAGALIVAIPNAFEAGHVLANARKANPGLRTIARAESEAEADYLRERGADVVIGARSSTAAAMLAAALADP